MMIYYNNEWTFDDFISLMRENNIEHIRSGEGRGVLEINGTIAELHDVITITSDKQRYLRFPGSLVSIDFDRIIFSENVVNLCYLFAACVNLTTVKNLYISSRISNLDYMFQNCENLMEIDVSNWDVSHVNSFASLFQNCKSLTSIDVSNWDVSKGVIFSRMFAETHMIFYNVENWNMSSAMDCSYMFLNCVLASSFDLAKWNTQSLENVSKMFAGCYRTPTIDVSNWDVSNITDFSSMFEDCRSVEELDLSNWKTLKTADSLQMFNGMERLTSLYISDGYNLRYPPQPVKIYKKTVIQNGNRIFAKDVELATKDNINHYVEYVTKLPTTPNKDIVYGIKHEEDIEKEYITRFTDILSTYFYEYSKNKWTINNVDDAIKVNGTQFKSAFMSGNKYFIYSEPECVSMLPGEYNAYITHTFTTIQHEQHEDYYVSNSEDKTYVKLANVDEVKKFFVRKDSKGTANGVASLDSNGRVPIEQMPVQAFIYLGQWDASAGVYPEDADTTGDFYEISVDGIIDGVEFLKGDWLVWSNEGWGKSENKNYVTEVNKQRGIVKIYGDNTAIETPSTVKDTDERSIKNYIDDATDISVNEEISAEDIYDSDIGILSHKPQTENSKKKWSFGTLASWIKSKISSSKVQSGDNNLVTSNAVNDALMALNFICYPYNDTQAVDKKDLIKQKALIAISNGIKDGETCIYNGGWKGNTYGYTNVARNNIYYFVDFKSINSDIKGCYNAQTEEVQLYNIPVFKTITVTTDSNGAIVNTIDGMNITRVVFCQSLNEQYICHLNKYYIRVVYRSNGENAVNKTLDLSILYF